ncbi:MAG: DUF3488 domain-containing transglutaminase family protein, partial [Gammaproteobacteria bacterium]|nr:DUF3488 domain-containing transglutaminase family protein [Gammaproteobacteria bacterium]
ISNLIRSNDVAFRVDFTSSVPAQHQLYWRGPVMAAFTGQRWHKLRRKRVDQLNINITEPPTRYTVTLEPNGEHWLLALDVPTQLVEDSLINADFQLISQKPINDLRRYNMESRLNASIGLDEDIEYLNMTSQYPADSNLQTIKFGKQLARQYRDKAEVINHVLRMFNEEEYTYTLQPPVLRDNVVDRFLFESRRGFCEHFAGSFALLMRTAGIPARIVTGYQGGEYNLVGNYLIVRQSDAHAWTEVWLKDKGWVRIDPTAAVSPSRIEQGIDSALADERSSFRIKNKNPLFGNLLYSWDSLQHSWNDWVINYDQNKQSRLLKDLDIGIESAGDMIIALVILLSTTTGSYWLFSWYRERPARPQKHEILFRRFLKKMSALGFEKKASEDNRHFLQRIARSNIEQYDRIVLIINLYNKIKYAKAACSEKQTTQLAGLVARI